MNDIAAEDQIRVDGPRAGRPRIETKRSCPACCEALYGEPKPSSAAFDIQRHLRGQRRARGRQPLLSTYARSQAPMIPYRISRPEMLEKQSLAGFFFLHGLPARA